MSNYIKVDSNRISRDGENVQEIIEAIPRFIDELETSMEKLSACWEGPSWAVYQVSMRAHIRELRFVYEYMGRYAGQMIQSGQDYMRTEQDICMDIKLTFT